MEIKFEIMQFRINLINEPAKITQLTKYFGGATFG